MTDHFHCDVCGLPIALTSPRYRIGFREVADKAYAGRNIVRDVVECESCHTDGEAV